MSYVDRLNSTGVPILIPLEDEKPATVSRTYCVLTSGVYDGQGSNGLHG